MDREPEERVLVVDTQVFDYAIAWAEKQKWRAPGTSLKCRYLSPGDVARFLTHLRKAVSSEPEAPSGPRARYSADASLRTFFGQKTNHAQLMELIAFLEGGGELVAEEAPTKEYRGQGRRFADRAARRTSL